MIAQTEVGFSKELEDLKASVRDKVREKRRPLILIQYPTPQPFRPSRIDAGLIGELRVDLSELGCDVRFIAKNTLGDDSG